MQMMLLKHSLIPRKINHRVGGVYYANEVTELH